MLQIERKTLDALGFDFAAAVAQYRDARVAHETTTEVPAPAAHPLVEAAVRAGGYEVLELPAPPPLPAPSVDDLKRMVEVERDRRLSVGFDFDFGDTRGVHRFGTTGSDRFGWAEVEGLAAAALDIGQASLPIAVRTDTGDLTIAAHEWPAVRLAGALALQPVWQASWTIKDEIVSGLLTDPAAIATHPAWPVST